MTQIKAQIEETTSDYDRRSCRSGWPSWPAAWPSSRSARPPRSSSRRRSTASRTRSRPPARRSRRASSPAAAPRCSRPSRRSTRSSSRATRRSASTSCAARSRSRCARSPRTPARKARSSWPRSSDLPVGQGYDALSGEYGDMFEKGIVDAAKVTRSALQNAASIAGMVLTTETLITDKPEKEKAMLPGPATATAATWTSSPTSPQLTEPGPSNRPGLFRFQGVADSVVVGHPPALGQQLGQPCRLELRLQRGPGIDAIRQLGGGSPPDSSTMPLPPRRVNRAATVARHPSAAGQRRRRRAADCETDVRSPSSRPAPATRSSSVRASSRRPSRISARSSTDIVLRMPKPSPSRSNRGQALVKQVDRSLVLAGAAWQPCPAPRAHHRGHRPRCPAARTGLRPPLSRLGTWPSHRRLRGRRRGRVNRTSTSSSASLNCRAIASASS